MGQQTSSRRVLVVDDNSDAADLVAQLMTMQGHAVAVAHGGREALAIAGRFVPDVVFLDIGMPEMDGYEVAVALRRAANLGGTRIVALTAWSNPDARARTAASGFDAHLVKPARVETLMNEAALGHVTH